MIVVDPLIDQGMRLYDKHVCSCHLFTDSDDLEELHIFAARIGLKRSFCKGDHYELTESKRRGAVYLGAVEVALHDPRLIRILDKRMERNLKQEAPRKGKGSVYVCRDCPGRTGGVAPACMMSNGVKEMRPKFCPDNGAPCEWEIKK